MSAHITMQDKITQEIDNYLQVSVQNNDESPLKWWKSEEAKFSLLEKWQKSGEIYENIMINSNIAIFFLHDVSRNATVKKRAYLVAAQLLRNVKNGDFDVPRVCKS